MLFQGGATSVQSFKSPEGITGTGGGPLPYWANADSVTGRVETKASRAMAAKVILKPINPFVNPDTEQ